LKPGRQGCAASRKARHDWRRLRYKDMIRLPGARAS